MIHMMNAEQLIQDAEEERLIEEEEEQKNA